MTRVDIIRLIKENQVELEKVKEIKFSFKKTDSFYKRLAIRERALKNKLESYYKLTEIWTE